MIRGDDWIAEALDIHKAVTIIYLESEKDQEKYSKTFER
jgi:hypothetical protein